MRRGHSVRAFSRYFTPERAQALAGTAQHQAYAHDLTATDFDGADVAVLTPPLTVSVAALDAVRATPRLIFFSSNNVAADAPGYDALQQAERRILEAAPGAVLLRPTLIYGDPALPFMPRLVRIVRALPIVPIPGLPSVRLQPIFHEDLGEIAARLCEDDRTGPASVGGAEVVTKAALLRMIAGALHRKRLFLPASAPLLRIAARLAGPLFPLDRAQLERLDMDRTAGEPAAPWLRGSTPLAEGLARLVARMDL